MNDSDQLRRPVLEDRGPQGTGGRHTGSVGLSPASGSAQSFATRALADSFRAQLMTAAKKGEGFDVETGLPLVAAAQAHGRVIPGPRREFAAFAWNNVAAKSRVSILETLSRVVPVVTRDLPRRPDPAVLRKALWKNLNQGDHAGPTRSTRRRRALAWLERASRPVSALEDESVVCDVLDALAFNLDGTRCGTGLLLPAAPRPAPGARLRGAQEAAGQEPSEQEQPARRLDGAGEAGRR